MVKKPKRELGPAAVASATIITNRHTNTTIDDDHNTKDIYHTDNPAVKCTKLPEFIRAKKQLDMPFYVYVSTGYVPDGTRLVVMAGNLKNPCAELRNNVARVWNNVARFDDLRFLGKSGRGTRFNIYMRFETEPPREAVYWNAIKVTVDGPRPPRNNKNNSIEKTTTNRRVQKIREEEVGCSTSQASHESFKPIKKRYRDFVTATSDVVVVNTISSSHLTPPESPNHHLTSLETSSGCSYASPNSKLCSPYSSMSPLSVSSSISDLSQLPHPSKLECSSPLSSTSLSTSCLPVVDRQSISHFLEIYMDLYKIKSYEGFSNYLVDLVQRYLHTSEYNYSRTHRLAGSERFLFNYNAFYQQLMKSDFRNLNLNSCMNGI